MVLREPTETATKSLGRRKSRGEEQGEKGVVWVCVCAARRTRIWASMSHTVNASVVVPFITQLPRNRLLVYRILTRGLQLDSAQTASTLKERIALIWNSAANRYGVCTCRVGTTDDAEAVKHRKRRDEPSEGFIVTGGHFQVGSPTPAARPGPERFAVLPNMPLAMTE